MKTILWTMVIWTLTTALCIGQDKVIAAKQLADKSPVIDDDVVDLERKLTDVERAYLVHRLENDGTPPLLDASEPTLFKKGQIGFLSGDGVTINTIVNPRELVVHDNRLWIEGISTEGLVTDAFVKFRLLFVVAGTKKYSTVIGASRTVPLLIAVDTTRADTVFAKILESRQFRQWTDAGGKTVSNAKFIEFKNNQVHLEQKGDGKKFEIPFRNLSKIDQKWIQGQNKLRSPLDRYRDQAIAARATAERSMKAKGFSNAEIEYIAFYVNNLGKRPKIDSEVDIRQVDDMIASEEVKDWREKEKKYLKERKAKQGY